MWLDRLGHAGQNPAQNGSRSSSPLPRRTSGGGGSISGGPPARGPYMTSQRPPRSSSLSLALNDSSTSLLPSRRASPQPPNQQNQQNQQNERPILSKLPDTSKAKDAEALAVLGKLLGESQGERSRERAPAREPYEITDADLEADFDFGGLSLRELVHSPDIRPRSLDQCNDDQAKLEELHESIKACDEVLSSVETNLTSFRNDLGTVSSDIESLQARSTALNVRLDNRKAVERGLASIVEDLSVSPMLVSKIVEGHIDEQWVQYLKEVDKRASQRKKDTSANPNIKIKAAEDLQPLLDKLVLKAIERIRDFLVAQIKALRSPHINAQIIQQQSFLKFKDLFAFLHKHHATLADEICLAYMNTMRWYYSNQFSRYAKALQRLKLHALDKADVLGHDDRARKSAASSFLSSAASYSSAYAGGGGSTSPHDAFNLGRRVDLLKGPSQVAMPSYMAEEDKTAHYLEVPFRHFNLALVDNATAEYTFMASFFSPALSYATISKHFNYIFEPTFAQGQTLTKLLIANGVVDGPAKTYDCLGVLLCIRLNQHFAFELQRRKIPAVDNYVNATNMLLWPRFQMIMNHHCESMHAATAATTSPATALGNDSASAGGPASVAPHIITQRFGQLLHGILVLSADAGDDEPVALSLIRLRNEVEAFLTKYSQVCFSGKANNGTGTAGRRRERFLYNNYSLVLTIISDVHGGSKLATEQKQHIEALKTAFEEGA